MQLVNTLTAQQEALSRGLVTSDEPLGQMIPTDGLQSTN